MQQRLQWKWKEMREATFDIRNRSCIPALTSGSEQLVYLGIAEILEQADELGPLPVGSTPGESVAVLEYLLAVLYAMDHAPLDAGEWREWVTSRKPLAEAAKDLRDEPADAWDLFDPERPLGQNACLAPWLDAHGVGPAQLAMESCGDYNQLFDHHHLHHPAPMPADQAFRHMLTQHAWGPYGRAMVKGAWLGSRLTNQALGRLASRLRTIAVGRTLGDTLRLNLTPTPGAIGTFNYSWTQGNDRPDFHRKAPRSPDGPAELHSWLGRSILLRPATTPEGDLVVDRVLMGGGDLLAAYPALSETFLQDAVVVTGKDGPTLLRPRADCALWREAEALYAACAERSKGEDLYSRLSQLTGIHVDLWTVGLNTSQSRPVTWVAATFPYTPGHEAALSHAAHTGHQTCRRVATALSHAALAAWRVLYPNPKPADKAAQLASLNASPILWAAAEALFHQLLELTDTTGSTTDALADFTTAVEDTARTALEQRLRVLPLTGPGCHARTQARTAFDKALHPDGPPSPHQQKDQPAVPDPRPATEHTGIDPALAALLTDTTTDTRPPGEQLLGWLCSLSRTHELGQLAQLRRRPTPRRTLSGCAHVRPPSLLHARRLAGNEATDAERDAFGFVAHLFALYHQGAPGPHRGYGSFGTALRKIGRSDRRGPKDDGATRLINDIVSARTLPERHLELAVSRLRSQREDRTTLPPSWTRLLDDVIGWNDPHRNVRETWGCDFFTPRYPIAKTTAPNGNGVTR